MQKTFRCRRRDGNQVRSQGPPQMKTADWALAISICSAALSLFTLMWNVWSKFIFPKPRLVVGFSLQGVFDQRGWHDPFLTLSITNHGPVPDIVTHSIVQVGNGIFTKRELGVIPNEFYRSQGPFSGGLPKKIEVGEEFSLRYWYGENWLTENVIRVGVVDSFNNKHWCRRSDVKGVKKTYMADKAAGKLAKQDRAS
jgi:hypothetical protein